MQSWVLNVGDGEMNKHPESVGGHWIRMRTSCSRINWCRNTFEAVGFTIDKFLIFEKRLGFSFIVVRGS